MKRLHAYARFFNVMMFTLLVVLMVASPFTVSLGSAPGVATAYAQTAQDQAPLSQTVCSGARGLLPDCWVYNIILFSSTLLVYISSWILGISGMLFNWLVGYTLIHFGDFYNTVKPAVEQAWTAFRDIANILIIGMFTFIAISMILGLKEYGAKKLVARVLIIAVLINFSLLFAKMIIDASNFTATQFYTAAGLSTVGGATGADGTASTASAGIAGRFDELLGVGTIGQTKNSLDQAGSASDSSLVLFMHAMFKFIIYLGAAVVLFYGSFLLVSRAIMLIFLLVTASIAFASYLIPKWEKSSSYGWDAWWSSLMWCVTLGPILMLSLWITLNVSTALHATTKGGSLGDMVANPSNTSNINAFVAYMLILGMLFASFKLSSAWASKIGGFSWAQMVPGTGLGLASIATGILGRNLVGWPAARRLGALRTKTFGGGRYDDQGNWVPGTKGYNAVNRFAATRLAGLQKASFNPLKIPGAGSVASTLGISKILAGAKMGDDGFTGVMKRKAKAADDLARTIGPTDKDATKALHDTEEHEREERRRHRETITTARQTQETIRTAIERDRPQAEESARQTQPERPIAEQRISAHEEAITRVENEKIATRGRHESEMRAAHDDIERAAVQARQEAELNTLDERLRGHQVDLAADRGTLANLNTAAQQAAQAALQPRLDAVTTALEQNARDLEALHESERVRGKPEKIAKDLERLQDVTLRKALLWDKRAAPQVESEIRAHKRRQAALDFRAAAADAAPTAPPAAPPAAP